MPPLPAPVTGDRPVRRPGRRGARGNERRRLLDDALGRRLRRASPGRYAEGGDHGDAEHSEDEGGDERATARERQRRLGGGDPPDGTLGSRDVEGAVGVHVSDAGDLGLGEGEEIGAGRAQSRRRAPPEGAVRGEAEEGRLKRCGRGIAVGGVLCHRPLDDGDQLRTHVGEERRDGRVDAAANEDRELRETLAVVRALPRRAFVEDDAEGINVAASIERARGAEDFRRHVERRAGVNALLGDHRRVGGIDVELGDAEVEHLQKRCSLAPREKQIRRLEVAMNDAQRGGRLRPLAGLRHDHAKVAEPEGRSAPEALLEGLSVKELHDDVRLARIEAPRVEGLDDVRVASPPRGRRFAEEPRDHLRLIDVPRMKELQRATMAGDLVIDFVDRPKLPLAEEPHDAKPVRDEGSGGEMGDGGHGG